MDSLRLKGEFIKEGIEKAKWNLQWQKPFFKEKDQSGKKNEV